MTTARARVRAPEFPSGDSSSWVNSAPLSLAELRGKIVLLDFWTFCCANCLHVIDELRELERDYADEVVIIGVHSPKFEHEKSVAAVRAATDRYRVAHAVFNDPAMHLWQQYAVRAWPTLVLIDPSGYVVAQAAGEGQATALRRIIDELIAEHDGRGTLCRGANPYVPPEPAPGIFRFPAKAIRRGDSLFVADAGHDEIVETMLDGATVVRRLTGLGVSEPNGLTLLPSDLAAVVGFELVVADTVNHVLRGVSLETGAVVMTVELGAALEGTTTVTGAIPSVLSPWDVVWWPALARVVVAAAGVHLLLSWSPVSGEVAVLAGTTVEGLKDGPARDGWLAQPSGLAVSPDGERLWFVDSETSALRWLSPDGELHTAIGEGLFDFGHVDGPAGSARLQHPLGVGVLPDGSVAIADTYNGAVRRYDPVANEVSTLASVLAEPSGVVVVDEDLLVVESAAHQIVRVPGSLAAHVDGFAQRTERPVTSVQAGRVSLEVVFEPPPGRKLDDRFGPPTRLSVSATPSSALVEGAGDGVELSRSIVLSAGAGEDVVLHVTAQAASCDLAAEAENPACYLARQDWGIPLRVTSTGGDPSLRLMLLG